MDEVNTIAKIKELVKELEGNNRVLKSKIAIIEHTMEGNKGLYSYLSTEFYRETKYLNRLTELLNKELS